MGNNSVYVERSAEESQRGGHCQPERDKSEEKNHKLIKDTRIISITLWLEPRKFITAEKHTKTA